MSEARGIQFRQKHRPSVRSGQFSNPQGGGNRREIQGVHQSACQLSNPRGGNYSETQATTHECVKSVISRKDDYSEIRALSAIVPVSTNNPPAPPPTHPCAREEVGGRHCEGKAIAEQGQKWRPRVPERGPLQIQGHCPGSSWQVISRVNLLTAGRSRVGMSTSMLLTEEGRRFVGERPGEVVDPLSWEIGARV